MRATRVLRKPDDTDENYWTWSGLYVGYRLSDGLFANDGHQVGYFAEGDEIYGCMGAYLGEIRSGNRLITNLKKKLWTRRSLPAQQLDESSGYGAVSAKEMLTGFEDFPAQEKAV